MNDTEWCLEKLIRLGVKKMCVILENCCDSLQRCDDKLAKWWKSTCGLTFMLDVSMTISIADDILLVVLAFRVVDR